MQEIWKSIGIKTYEVSNLGNVKGLSGRLIKTYKKPDGYRSIQLSRIGTFQVHYLVLLAFIGERPIGLDIDHINRIRDDNRLENLRYCTRSENNMNTIRTRNDILEIDPTIRVLLRNKKNQKKYREARKLLSTHRL